MNYRATLRVELTCSLDDLCKRHWEVRAPSREIDAQILEKIGDLECCADSIACCELRRWHVVLPMVKTEKELAYGICRIGAIGENIFPGRGCNESDISSEGFEKTQQR